MQNISLLILALFPLLGTANAQTLVLPHGTVAYSNITIGSWAGVPSRYVQQVITLNLSKYKAAELQYTHSFANFEFTYENGTVVPSWIESNISGNLIIWINITNTTAQIELDIFNSTTNLLSSSGTSGIGESPQLSSKYDDGAKVFPSYNSTSLPLAPPRSLRQMFNIPKSNYNNFELFYGNGTIIPAWVEINSSGIMPAVTCNNTSTNTIGIAFLVLFIVLILMSILCLKEHKHK